MFHDLRGLTGEISWTRASAVLLAGLCTANASFASEPEKLVVRPGSAIILDSAACVRPLVPGANGAVETAKVSDAKTFAIYTAPPSQSADVLVLIETGSKDKTDKSGCESAVQRQFTISTDRTPQIPDSAIGKAFNILAAAFVLALLLESAFALLFNWRLFLEFFAGKAWRTPIMFVGALATVSAFNLDLMASLLDAYSPRADGLPSKGSWLTAALTSMILAGGSVGVNRILVALGFRSQIRSDVAEPKIEEDEAWISIQVLGKSRDINVRVDVEVAEASEATKGAIPTTVGMLRPRGALERLGNILFPSRSRWPRSGGRKVSTNNFYRITVTDLRSDGKVYDALGKVIPNVGAAPLLRFGSRAMIDFEVTLPR